MAPERVRRASYGFGALGIGECIRVPAADGTRLRQAAVAWKRAHADWQYESSTMNGCTTVRRMPAHQEPVYSRELLAAPSCLIEAIAGFGGIVYASADGLTCQSACPVCDAPGESLVIDGDSCRCLCCKLTATLETWPAVVGRHRVRHPKKHHEDALAARRARVHGPALYSETTASSRRPR